MHFQLPSSSKTLCILILSLLTLPLSTPSPLLQPRAPPSDLHDLLHGGAGGNSYTWTADSITYNLTLEVSSDCPSAVNETLKVGPYQDSKGHKFAEATMGDIANDVASNLSPARLHRSTRRNVAAADKLLKSLLSDQLLCDDKDAQLSVDIHDELRRKLLDVHTVAWVGIGASVGFLYGAASTTVLQTAITGNTSTSDVITTGVAVFWSVVISSITQQLYTMDRTRNNPYLFFNAISAFVMRNFGAVVPAGPMHPMYGWDIEMGVGVDLGQDGGPGGKVKRDKDKCVTKADAKIAFERIAVLKSDEVGLASWTELSKAAGACPLSD